MEENKAEGEDTPEEVHTSAFPVIESSSVVTIIWKDSNKEFACIFCKRFTVDELGLGPLYRLPNEGVVTHYFCMLFSAGLVQQGDDRQGILGFLPADIFKEARRAQRLKCTYCHIYGASIGCNTSRCKVSFHFPCGLANEANLQFFKNYQAFCKNHSALPDLDIALTERLCPICLSLVEPPERPIVGPCCKTAIFHKLCIQRLALNAGYYFKCPTCNSHEDFPDSSKLQGIFVPEQDASWERDPDAYQDLYQVYNHCDAETCECPKGPDYAANKGSWLLARCRICGSCGTHRQCGKLTTISNWACASCLAVEERTSKNKPIEEPLPLPVEEPRPSTSTGSYSTSNHVSLNTTSITSGMQPQAVVVNNTSRKSKIASVAAVSKKSAITSKSTINSNTKAKSTLIICEEKTEVKASSKRAKRTGVPADSSDLNKNDDDDFDLSQIHIQPSCRDYFPHSKEKKAKYAKEHGSLPDWRKCFLQIQMIDVFLDAFDAIHNPVILERPEPGAVPRPINNVAVTTPKTKQSDKVPKVPVVSKKKNNKTKNRKRVFSWSKGWVQRKKKPSAPKAKPTMQPPLRKTIEATVEQKAIGGIKRPIPPSTPSASQAVLVGIRRSHGSLLQLQAQKGDDARSVPKNNGISESVNGKQNADCTAPKKTFRDAALGNIQTRESANCVYANDDCHSDSLTITESTRTSCSSGDVKSQSTNGVSLNQSQFRGSDKPVVKIEVDDGNIQQPSRRENLQVPLLTSPNGRSSLELELQQSAHGIARHLLNLGDPNEANRRLRFLEMKCPQLFKDNSSSTQ